MTWPEFVAAWPDDLALEFETEVETLAETKWGGEIAALESLHKDLSAMLEGLETAGGKSGAGALIGSMLAMFAPQLDAAKDRMLGMRQQLGQVVAALRADQITRRMAQVTGGAPLPAEEDTLA